MYSGIHITECKAQASIQVTFAFFPFLLSETHFHRINNWNYLYECLNFGLVYFLLVMSQTMLMSFPPFDPPSIPTWAPLPDSVPGCCTTVLRPWIVAVPHCDPLWAATRAASKDLAQTSYFMATNRLAASIASFFLFKRVANQNPSARILISNSRDP